MTASTLLLTTLFNTPTRLFALLGIVLMSYLIGSISFSVVFCHVFGKADIRKYGSGNAGTTNMLRVYGIWMAVLTFICDCAKGVLCCYLTALIFGVIDENLVLRAEYISALFVVVGHIYSAYHRYKGGKGFATMIGIMLYVQPIVMLFTIVGILLLLVIFDRMSVVALLFGLFLVVYYWVVLYSLLGILPCVCITCVVILSYVAHRQNIARIFKGCEPSLGITRKLFKRKSI